jgi:phospholipase C
VPANLDAIQTVVILMMENRSFDHMLGYLSLPKYAGSYPSMKDVNGLRDDQDWLNSVANKWQGNSYFPIPLADARIPDPPHERKYIATQLGTFANGKYPLDGFITSANGTSDVMNYQTPATVPITDFFARNFRICDRWFSCIPAGTQPNRMMAMSGYTQIDVNHDVLPNQLLAYDWLSSHQVRWRVYHQGFFPFYAMMPRWAAASLGDQFRTFDRFAIDVELEGDATFPQVIFVEPKYTDAPHEGEGTDDHSPSSVHGGQQLMHDVYASLAKSKHWSNTVFIITYDEHGGLWDHEQPIKLETDAPLSGKYPVFETSGVRVPGLIVSPFVSAASVFHQNLDHTSILKFLGERFGQGGGYLPEVDKREVASVADALDLLDAPRQQQPPTAPMLPAVPAATAPIPLQNTGPMVDAFKKLHQDLATRFPHELATKFPTKRAILGV